MKKNKPNSKGSILITGCSSGIGYCVAHGLQERGYQVIASARKAGDVVRLKQEGLTAIRLDLDSSDSIQQAMQQLKQLISGPLYALFNNGAYGQPGAVEDLTRDTLRAQLETNLLGWHELTCAVLPMMREAGEGRIIQNSSVLGLVTLTYRGAYNCSKFALEGLSATLRQELHATGIHVCLIEPGPIESRFRKNSLLKWQQNIDASNSVHQQKYQAMLARLQTEGPAVPFTLPPQAVLKRVIHALESPRPKAHYYVTFPTYLFGFLRRILSASAMDAVLRKLVKN
ncbi:MAG: SDR family oxidoreductase [gamma proteobacterium symbiont of Bathyaustriella thionipta]|nr:SDR family oxidoreductase [gamma proteobacterium symbiont of Bathyaustriella thionipta]